MITEFVKKQIFSKSYYIRWECLVSQSKHFEKSKGVGKLVYQWARLTRKR